MGHELVGLITFQPVGETACHCSRCAEVQVDDHETLVLREPHGAGKFDVLSSRCLQIEWQRTGQQSWCLFDRRISFSMIVGTAVYRIISYNVRDLTTIHDSDRQNATSDKKRNTRTTKRGTTMDRYCWRVFSQHCELLPSRWYHRVCNPAVSTCRSHIDQKKPRTQSRPSKRGREGTRAHTFTEPKWHNSQQVQTEDHHTHTSAYLRSSDK